MGRVIYTYFSREGMVTLYAVPNPFLLNEICLNQVSSGKTAAYPLIYTNYEFDNQQFQRKSNTFYVAINKMVFMHNTEISHLFACTMNACSLPACMISTPGNTTPHTATSEPSGFNQSALSGNMSIVNI